MIWPWTLQRLEDPLRRMADDLAAIRATLERIERLLMERLPPR